VIAACWAIVFAMPSLAGAAGNAWQALVKSEACVQGKNVILGEIAVPLDDMARQQWETLSGIKLWKASEKKGRPVSISRGKLQKVLEYYMGDVANNLVLPSQLTVQTGGRVIGGDEIKNRVVAFLTPRAKDLGGDVEYKNLNLPRHMFFPNMYDKLAISMKSDVKPGNNRIRLNGVTPDGKVVSRKTGTVFLNVWKAMPVAAKPLNRFERLTKNKVSFRRVNLAYKPAIWDGSGGPWRMARTLGAGQVFTLSHLEPVPLIEKGERVTLLYQGKRIQLRITAEALGEAGIGQQVTVRNLQSRKTILATVVSDDTVVVR